MTAQVWVGIVLAGVLALSGVAKLRDRESTGSAIVLLRLPRMLRTNWVTWALPIGELVLALALLVSRTPVVVVPAVAAVALFLIYLVVIARAMTFDVRPTCGCFGRIGDQRVRPKTVVRNGLLVALSGWFLADSLRGGSVPGRLGAFTPDDGWWLLAALIGTIVAVLVILPAPGAARPTSALKVEVVADEPQELDYLRTPFPPATLIDHTGRPQSLADLTAEAAVLLIGMDCTCGTVAQVAGQLPGWREQLDPVRLLVFTPAEPNDLRRAFDLPDADLLVDHQYQLWDQWNLVRGMPAAVLLGADRMLAGGPVTGPTAVTEFVDEVIAQLAETFPPGADSVDKSDPDENNQPQASESTQA